MTDKELEYLKNTVTFGTGNKSNDVWIKAFKETYPHLSMDIEMNYMKVLCKLAV